MSYGTRPTQECGTTARLKTRCACRSQRSSPTRGCTHRPLPRRHRRRRDLHGSVWTGACGRRCRRPTSGTLSPLLTDHMDGQRHGLTCASMCGDVNGAAPDTLIPHNTDHLGCSMSTSWPAGGATWTLLRTAGCRAQRYSVPSRTAVHN
eukprot:364350-Chlamydomonas_euryale.AAC.6